MNKLPSQIFENFIEIVKKLTDEQKQQYELFSAILFGKEELIHKYSEYETKRITQECIDGHAKIDKTFKNELKNLEENIARITTCFSQYDEFVENIFGKNKPNFEKLESCKELQVLLDEITDTESLMNSLKKMNDSFEKLNEVEKKYLCKIIVIISKK